MAEVDFGSDEVDWGELPAVLGGVALLELEFTGGFFLEAWRTGDEPFEITIAIDDHFVSKVSAVDVIVVHEGFLENDASATEGIEQSSVACWARIETGFRVAGSEVN